jgi:hypothetical protein
MYRVSAQRMYSTGNTMHLRPAMGAEGNVRAPSQSPNRWRSQSVNAEEDPIGVGTAVRSTSAGLGAEDLAMTIENQSEQLSLLDEGRDGRRGGARIVGRNEHRNDSDG